MSREVPAHHENPDTLQSEPLQLFDIDASADFPPRPARPRPVDRPRLIPPTDGGTPGAGSEPASGGEATDPPRERR